MNIVIGEPLVSLESLGIKENEEVFRTDEIFLPKILKQFGIFKSTSQVKKNRPDLWRELEEFEFTKLEIGHKRIFIIKGEWYKFNFIYFIDILFNLVLTKYQYYGTI